MTDIFDAKIMCKKCNKVMEQTIVNKNGFELRAVKCPECGDKIIHPADLNGLSQFNNLKDKTFNVKLRMVGNSHAISIPKEIIDFMNERQKDMHRHMDDMVKLMFDDFDTLRVQFWNENIHNIHRNIDESVEDDEYEDVDSEDESLNNSDIDRMKIKKSKDKRRQYD